MTDRDRASTNCHREPPCDARPGACEALALLPTFRRGSGTRIEAGSSPTPRLTIGAWPRRPLRPLRDRGRRVRARVERGRHHRRVVAGVATGRPAHARSRAARAGAVEAEPPAAVAAAIDAIDAPARRRARRPRRRAARRSPRIDAFRSPRLRRRARPSRRAACSATARSRARVGADATARAVGQALGAQSRFRSSCRAIASSPPAARSAASRRPAARRPSAACWRSRTRAPTGRPTCSTRARRRRRVARLARRARARLRSPGGGIATGAASRVDRRPDRRVGALAGTDHKPLAIARCPSASKTSSRPGSRRNSPGPRAKTWNA